jgi:SAM-dependent methyltransferase
LGKTLLRREIRRVGIDSSERTLLHSQIVREKTFLRKLYTEWYTAINDLMPGRLTGCIVELGSGGGFSKKILPRAITTEILPLPNVDLRLDGVELPFKGNSLKAIFMVDVFHHLPRSEQFLKEAARCVKPGGVLVMIEPWNTPWSRFIYRYFHHEPFDPDSTDWKIPIGRPLSEANSALPWIVFDRDRLRFEKEYPQWRIRDIRRHTPFRYLLSGGVSMRGSMPGRLFEFWQGIEDCLGAVMKYLAMFATIVLIRSSFENSIHDNPN